MPSPASKDLASIADQLAELAAIGEPASIHLDLPVFTEVEVFNWITAAHPREHEDVARQKLAALRTSWGLQPPPDPRPADPGRPAELFGPGGQILDPTPYLPGPSEAFPAWVTRVRDALGRFGMMAPGLECASWDALHRLQALLHPVLATTGPRTYRFNAFLGDYARTPFGYHVDPHQELVFQYVITGTRTARFWDGLSLTPDDAAWLESPTATPGRPPDVELTLGPGDLVFWPGSAVHGMESDGPSMALSLVVDRASPRTRQAVIDGLECATAGGRPALPAVDEHATIELSDVLERRSAYPLRYERFDDALIVGVCGRTFDWPDPRSTTDAMRLLDRLEAPPACSVATLIEQAATDALPAALVAETLAMLVALGYLARAH